MSNVVVGVAGGTASGKGFITDKTIKLLQAADITVSVLPMDNYYKAQDEKSIAQREKNNYDCPEALDLDLLAKDLQQLKNGLSLRIPKYCFKEHTRIRNDSQPIAAANVIVVDGIMAFCSPELRDLIDLRVFVDAPEDRRLARRLLRDIKERGRTAEGVVDQWYKTVKDGHNRFVEPTKKHAHFVILNDLSADELTQHLREVVNLLAATIRGLVQNKGLNLSE